MSFVDVILTIDESDKPSSYDCRVLDRLEQMFPVSRTQLREGLLPRVYKAVELDVAYNHTYLGRRPLHLVRCLYVDDHYTYLLVAMPLGSTWRAINAGYMFIQDLLGKTDIGDRESYEVSSAIREYAHSHIVPLLDTAGEFSRYPFDAKIAYDLLFTLKLALTRGQLGMGQAETIDSVYIDIDSLDDTVNLSKRETRQLGLMFKYKPLPM